jgi:hypothetical protein
MRRPSAPFYYRLKSFRASDNCSMVITRVTCRFMENHQVSFQRVRGNNVFGRKGRPRCEECRRGRRKVRHAIGYGRLTVFQCEYLDLKLPCDSCVSRGWSCGEKFSAGHRRSLHRLNEAPFVAQQLRILEQGHQRFAWLDRPPQLSAHPVNQSMGEQNRLNLPSSASVNDEVGLMIMNHFSFADPATVKAIVTEEVKSFDEKGGLESAVGIFAPQNPSPRPQGILLVPVAHMMQST